MEIRPLEGDADVEGLIRTRGRAWREAYDEILPDAVLAEITVDPTPEDVADWNERLGGDRRALFVAVVDGTVRGFVDVCWDDERTKPFVGPDEAGLKGIYVDPEWWGEGIGSALLGRAIDALPSELDAVRLEAFADNAIGAGFYASRGFERTGTSAIDVAGEGEYATDVWARRL